MSVALACMAAPAAGEGIRRGAGEAGAISSGKPDVFSAVLEACPLENRRAFLGSIKFSGIKVVSFGTGAIKDCLHGYSIADISDRFARVGKNDAPKETEVPALEFGELFSACSSSVRGAFYDRLVFSDGRIVAMFVGAVKRCAGKRDMRRFLSLFGSAGMDAGEWNDDCYCGPSGDCVSKPGFSCHRDNCRRASSAVD